MIKVFRSGTTEELFQLKLAMSYCWTMSLVYVTAHRFVLEETPSDMKNLTIQFCTFEKTGICINAPD